MLFQLRKGMVKNPFGLLAVATAGATRPLICGNEADAGSRTETLVERTPGGGATRCSSLMVLACWAYADTGATDAEAGAATVGVAAAWAGSAEPAASRVATQMRTFCFMLFREKRRFFRGKPAEMRRKIARRFFRCSSRADGRVTHGDHGPIGGEVRAVTRTLDQDRLVGVDQDW